jgi:hypothetical protein
LLQEEQGFEDTVSRLFVKFRFNSDFSVKISKEYKNKDNELGFTKLQASQARRST